MSQTNTNGVKAFTAGAAIAANLRVVLTSGKLAVAGVGGGPDEVLDIGTITQAAFADLDVRPVRLRTAEGTTKMVAAGAIAAGAAVYGAASGKISATINGSILGLALEAATANNDVIEVLRGWSTLVEPGIKLFTAGGAIAVNLRVMLTSSKLAVAGVGVTDELLEIGTILTAAAADLDIRPVRLRSAQGTTKMVASAAIAVGAAVYGAAAGKIATTVSGSRLGVALTAAAADGDTIEVVPA